MRERDRKYSIRKQKLVKSTTFALTLLVATVMIISSAVSAINVNVNTTQMNEEIIEGGQIAPLSSGAADSISGTPITDPVVKTPQMGHGPEYIGQHRGGVVIYDNGMSYIGLASAQDDSVYGLDTRPADDFSFYTGGDDVCINDVHWIGGFWNGVPVEGPWCIEFYEDDGTGNAPGALYAGPFCIAWDDLSVIDLGGQYYELGADIDEVCFPGCGEKFWITIYADLDFPPQSGVGYHYWAIGHEMVFKSAYFGFPDWTDGSLVFGDYYDLAFQLTQKPDHDVYAVDIDVDVDPFCECVPVTGTVGNGGTFDETGVEVVLDIKEMLFFDDFDLYGPFPWDDGCVGCTWAIVLGETAPPYVVTPMDNFMAEFDQTAGSGSTCLMWTITGGIDLSDTCNPKIGFWMWHDDYGSDDFLRVQIDDGGGFVTIGPVFERADGNMGWTFHEVDIPDSYIGSSIEIGFLGFCDTNGGAYNMHIDDVSVYDLAYRAIEIVDIDVGDEIEIEFPDFCPCQWGTLADATIDYVAELCVFLDIDQVPGNDCVDDAFSLYFPFLHDVGAIGVTYEDQGCLEFDICSTIYNFGQYEECCFKTYVQIREAFYHPPVYGGTVYVNEQFPTSLEWPTGWTSNPDGSYPYYSWEPYYSSAPGGSPYCARLYWYYARYPDNYLMSPAVDTTAESGLMLEFKSFVDIYYTTYNCYVLATDGVSGWTDITPWPNPVPANQGPATYQIDISAFIGPATQVQFVGNGYYFDLDYWYIDDVSIEGFQAEYYTFGPVEYSEWYCVDTIDICEEQEICFDSWIPAKPWPDCGSKEYEICAWTALCDPMDDNPANDYYCEIFTVDFLHDIAIEATSPTTGKAPWDLLFSFDVEAATGALGNAGAECDGQYFYTTRWASNLIHQYDLSGNMIKQFSISGVSGLRDLAYDGQYFYGGASGSTIYQMDFASETLVGTIPVSGNTVRAISYNDDLDAFYVSNWGDPVTLVDKTGATITSFNLGTTTSTYGFAYDNQCNPGTPYLWVYDQSGSGQVIYQWDLNAGAYTGFTYDTSIDFANSGIAGGLWTEVYGGKFCVGGLSQGTPDMMFVYELCDAQGAVPEPDIWVGCGEQDICVNVANIGTFDEVDDPATPCDFEGIVVYMEMYKYIIDDPCEPPVMEFVMDGMQTLELLCGEEAEVCFGSYDFDESGIYEINFLAEIDPTGLPDDCNPDDNEDQLVVGVDCCPPESEHEIDPAFPDGNNNWYLGAVEVVITAEDPLCPDPCYGTSSGLKEIHWKINGDEDFETGSSVDFDITEQGVNLVEYWAIDNAGNEEEHFTFEIAIDSSDPDVDLVYEKIEDGTLQVEFTAIVADTVSGIEKVEFYIGGSLELTVTTPPYKWLITWQDSYKTETFKAVAYDLAGNSGQSTVPGSDIPGARVNAAQSMNLPTSVPRTISQNI